MKRTFSTSLILGFVATLASAVPSFGQDGGIAALKERERMVKAVVSAAIPATVAIEGVTKPASGSGVIVSQDGLILTAAHVTAAAGRELLVTFPDGREVSAISLGANASRDAGMAKIQDEGDWPFVEMGDPNSVELGEWCVALGHPGGYDPDRTPPVRLGRVWTKRFMGMIGSDCTLVGGDSGGPLFDLNGKLIGIHSSIGGSLAENRHVPMDAYTDNWDDLSGGRLWGSQGLMMGRVDPERPALGVGIEQARGGGVAVTSVTDRSPAAAAGIEIGDVIRKAGGKKVAGPMELIEYLGTRKLGDKLKIQLERGEEAIEVEVTLEPLGELWGLESRSAPDEEEADPEPAAANASLGVHLKRDAVRAEVFDVVPESAAAKAGVEAGDVILRVDRTRISGAAEMALNIRSRSAGDRISLRVKRGDRLMDIEVTLGSAPQ